MGERKDGGEWWAPDSRREVGIMMGERGRGCMMCLAHGRRMVYTGWMRTSGDIVGGHIYTWAKDTGERMAHRPLDLRDGSEGCRVSLILIWQTGTIQKSKNGKQSAPSPAQPDPAWSPKSEQWDRRDKPPAEISQHHLQGVSAKWRPRHCTADV